MDYGGYNYYLDDGQLTINVYLLEFCLIVRALKVCDNDLKQMNHIKTSRTYNDLDPVLKEMLRF